MRIVLDASTIIAEGYGRSARFKTLLSASTIAGYTVFVPRLVVAETAAKLSRELDERKRKGRRGLGQRSRLLAQRLELPAIDLGSLEDTTLIEEDLLTRFTEAGVAILPYPKVSHEELSSRAISRTRPFNDKGSG